MAVDPNIIIGISTAVGAGVGGAITLLGSRRQAHIDAIQEKYRKLENHYIDACEQIESFHKIEEACAKEISTLAGKPEQQVKLEIRKRVEDGGGGRPSWSAREARNEIKRIRG